jgi:hypothetical protein
MRKLRRITEAQVIAEFLKNEFYQEEFHHDRENFEQLVLEANVTNETENALRRALLFRRRGHMWRELPSDTQWWEVEIEISDLNLLRVFPRAQWRRVADGSFLLRDIVERIRTVRFKGHTRDFISKVQALSYRIRVENDASSVLLIGIDEQKPFTILEGNHRLTAALLAGPGLMQKRFRVLCGFSPSMAKSCWYETNLENLWRYGKNRLRHLFYDKEADISRILKNAMQGSAPAPVEVSARDIVPGSTGTKSA